jgi:hypothetical protein
MNTPIDILVWVDENGDVLYEGLTQNAISFLRIEDPEYMPEDIIEIHVSPEEFAERIPRSLNVMVQCGQNKFVKLSPGTLQ